MGMILHVGDLPYSLEEDDLADIFRPLGLVETAAVVREIRTGRSKACGFVGMATVAESQAAISYLHMSRHEALTILVSEARPGSGHSA